jgi:hypothetical protein
MSTALLQCDLGEIWHRSGVLASRHDMILNGWHRGTKSCRNVIAGPETARLRPDRLIFDP